MAQLAHASASPAGPLAEFVRQRRRQLFVPADDVGDLMSRLVDEGGGSVQVVRTILIAAAGFSLVPSHSRSPALRIDAPRPLSR